MYERQVAHVCNSKLTPESPLGSKKLGKTMRSTPLGCQNVMDEMFTRKGSHSSWTYVSKRGAIQSRDELK